MRRRLYLRSVSPRRWSSATDPRSSSGTCPTRSPSATCFRQRESMKGWMEKRISDVPDQDAWLLGQLDSSELELELVFMDSPWASSRHRSLFSWLGKSVND